MSTYRQTALPLRCAQVVAVFGDLRMVTAPPATPWTTLNTTANAGDTTLTLSSSVDWKVGDRVILASTEYTHEDEATKQHEELTIAGVDGRVVTVASALKHRHFAGHVGYAIPNKSGCIFRVGIWVSFLISLGSPHVRRTSMGHTCGEPNEVDVTAAH